MPLFDRGRAAGFSFFSDWMSEEGKMRGFKSFLCRHDSPRLFFHLSLAEAQTRTLMTPPHRPIVSKTLLSISHKNYPTLRSWTARVIPPVRCFRVRYCNVFVFLVRFDCRRTPSRSTATRWTHPARCPTSRRPRPGVDLSTTLSWRGHRYRRSKKRRRMKGMPTAGGVHMRKRV